MNSGPQLAVAMGLATGLVTSFGGGLVLRFRSALDLLLGFASGAVIGVALFDLLPEALDIATGHRGPLQISTALGIGFILYLTLDRSLAILASDQARSRGLAPATLAFHSFLDGLGIGLAFHVSSAAGVIVAIGVLGHDLIDGANIVAVTLSNGSRNSIVRAWLAVDALAPLAGILLAGGVTIPASLLAPMLGIFGGFFLYIGATELLPRSEARRPRASTVAATVIGMSFIYAVVFFATYRR